MPNKNVVGFIDLAYLKHQGGLALGFHKPARLDVAGFAGWLGDGLYAPHGYRYLRTYIYDGLLADSQAGYRVQKEQFDQIGKQPYVRVRLGHQVTRDREGEPVFQQKGVDTLLVLDLLQMARNGVYDTALLITGDRDFEEPVRVVQDEMAKSVVLFTPPRGVSQHLVRVADLALTITPDALSRFLIED